MNNRRIVLVRSLLLAVGIIAATLISLRTSESGWLVLAGPLVLAGSIVLASVIGHRTDPRKSLAVGLILGASVVIASAIVVALANPARVATLMPILGGGGAVVVWGNRCIPARANRNAVQDV